MIRDSTPSGTTRDSRITIHAFSWKVRMVFWLALALATAWLLWYMVKVPGASYSGALAPLAAEEQVIAGHLRRHVAAIASIACPVLVVVVSSLLKSTTSLPIAAPLSVPASRPKTSASP